jgi:hypothetical protein
MASGDIINRQPGTADLMPSLPRTLRALGPRAALRTRMDRHLLSDLPDWRLKFSTPKGPAEYARLRLFIGVYNVPGLQNKRRKVDAYLKPKSSLTTGPGLDLKYEKAFNMGGPITRNMRTAYAIRSDEIILEPIFKAAMNEAQLCALIKYYFLLAVEDANLGFEQHFIPINNDFLKCLKTVYDNWFLQRSHIIQTRPTQDSLQRRNYNPTPLLSAGSGSGQSHSVPARLEARRSAENSVVSEGLRNPLGSRRLLLARPPSTTADESHVRKN